MSETIASQVLDRARTTGKVADEDVTALRREIYDSGAVDQDELKNLFEIERARSAHNPLWSALFREAVVDLALFRTPPSGYLSDDNAQWLIAQIGDRKDARTDTELEALAALVERAQQVPLDFSAYVLRQIKNAVVYADGPDAAGRTLTPGAIAGPEIKLIQRVLWGAGCGGHLAISRDEAEALFEIADFDHWREKRSGLARSVRARGRQLSARRHGAPGANPRTGVAILQRARRSRCCGRVDRRAQRRRASVA